MRKGILSAASALLLSSCAPVYDSNTDVNLLGNVDGKEIWKIEASPSSGPWSYVVASEPLDQLLRPERFSVQKVYSNMDLMQETTGTVVLRDLGDREIVVYANREVGSKDTKVTFRLRQKATIKPGALPNIGSLSWGYTCEVFYSPEASDWKLMDRLKGTFRDSSRPTMSGNQLLTSPESVCTLIRLKKL